MPRIVPQKPQQPSHQTPDEFLRGAGFVIVSRPAKGEAVWRRDGRKYTQSEAMRRANEEWANALDAIENK